MVLPGPLTTKKTPRLATAVLASASRGGLKEPLSSFESGILAPFRETDRRSGLIDSYDFHTSFSFNTLVPGSRSPIFDTSLTVALKDM